MTEDTALVVQNGHAEVQVGVVRPVAALADIAEAWKAFAEVKQQLLEESDYQSYQGTRRVKKSGWRKIAAAFGISTELRSEQRRDVGDSAWVWDVTVRAYAPNGRFCDGSASFDSRERKMAHPEHDTRATAFTRACNRAVADLVGGGEVSAEEVEVTAPAAPAYVPPTMAQLGRLYALARERRQLEAQDVDALFTCSVSSVSLAQWCQATEAPLEEAGTLLVRLLEPEAADERARVMRQLARALGLLARITPGALGEVERATLEYVLGEGDDPDVEPDAF